MAMTDWNVDTETKSLIIEKIKSEPSFKNCFKRDLTQQINENLHNRMFGKMTNHFLIMIRGVRGLTTTGTFKSSSGIEIARMFDKQFNANKIAFHNEELLNKIQQLAKVTEQGKEIPQVFVRDETPESLRRRASVEFSIVAESLRDSRISLILIKPVMEDLDLAHYILEPFLITKDMKKVRLAVYNHGSSQYRGYYELKIHLNNPVWKEYMKLKKKYEELVIQRKVGVFDPKEYAKKFLKKHSIEAVSQIRKDGTIKVIQTRLMRYLSREFYNLTHEERKFIADEIKEQIED